MEWRREGGNVYLEQKKKKKYCEEVVINDVIKEKAICAVPFSSICVQDFYFLIILAVNNSIREYDGSSLFSFPINGFHF